MFVVREKEIEEKKNRSPVTIEAGLSFVYEQVLYNIQAMVFGCNILIHVAIKISKHKCHIELSDSSLNLLSFPGSVCILTQHQPLTTYISYRDGSL